MIKKALAILLILGLVFTSVVACGNNDVEPTNDDQVKEDTKDDTEDNKKEDEPKEEPKEEPKVEQVVTYNMGADPETLDPGKATENVGFNVIINTFEGLTNLDENDKAIPGVAKKWDVNEDATEFTFYLRDDAKWSDGKPVTAYDFEYAWKRVINPETASDYAYQLFYLKNAEDIINGEASIDELGVEVIDERTLKVTLQGPVSWMLEMFAFPTYFPVRKDVVEENPDTWALEADTIVSNGPFKISEWSHNEEVVMVRNENYWDKERVKLDKYIMTLINEDTTALAAFEAGDIDGTDGVPRAEIPRLQAENDDFMILPDLGLYYYTFNNKVEPFNNEKVRKAFTLAIDRSAIVNTVSMGGETPATGVVPVGINIGGEDFREAGGDYDIDPNKAKIEEAKKLLEEAGYPNGEGLPEITLNYNTNENHQRIAEAVQEMWKKNLNVNVTLGNAEWKVHLSNLSEGNYQVARIGWGADYAHPMTFLDLFISASGNNYTQYTSEEFDDYIRKAKSTIDIQKANDYMHKAEDLFMERYTVCPIYFASDPELMKSYVKGWRKSPLGYLYMDKAYIEGK
ncbi:MAG: peptide ABC transporter substrate-binding protein [Firmicutes bacterium]|nr:peptide ABC transporter substrate-binding protein [Bacillota bacterium]